MAISSSSTAVATLRLTIEEEYSNQLVSTITRAGFKLRGTFD